MFPFIFNSTILNLVPILKSNGPCLTSCHHSWIIKVRSPLSFERVELNPHHTSPHMDDELVLRSSPRMVIKWIFGITGNYTRIYCWTAVFPLLSLELFKQCLRINYSLWIQQWNTRNTNVHNDNNVFELTIHYESTNEIQEIQMYTTTTTSSN